MIRFIILVALLIVSACGGSVSASDTGSASEPVCSVSTYQGRLECDSSYIMPILLECDSHPTSASITRYVGAGFSCADGKTNNTVCCELAK